MSNLLRIAGVVKESIVDGPGIRYVVFTQGCPHHCKGCHNPQTHDYNGGKLVDINVISDDINKNPLLKGVTISGGEPFEQAKMVSCLLDLINSKLTVMVYTGYKFEDLLDKSNTDEDIKLLLSKIDVLVDGKFELSLRDISLDFRGSSNQRIIDVKKSLKDNSVVLYSF